MDLGLAGKVAIVGGASSGIGFAIARQLAGEGARVVMTARKLPELENAARRIAEETGAITVPIASNCRSAEDIDHVVNTTLGRFGIIDVVVNNDGAPPVGDVLGFDDAAWGRAVEQNLMSVVRMVRTTVPHMRDGGRIVNITASTVLEPRAGYGLLVSTWAGVIGFARTLAVEYGSKGITINTICPGAVDSPRLRKVFGAESSEGNPRSSTALDELVNDIPLKRLAEASEIAALATFLVSRPGAYITGTTTRVDGGLVRNLT